METTTHFVPFDAIRIGRHQRAFCGQLVSSREHSNQPTCSSCARTATAPPLLSRADDHPSDLFDVEPVFDELAEVSDAQLLFLSERVAVAPQAPVDGLVRLEQRAIVVPALVEESEPFIEQALTHQVRDAETCLHGERIFDTLRSFEQAAHNEYDEDCGLAHQLWKSLTDKRGVVLKPIEAARKAIGDRVADWKFTQQEREKAEQRTRERLAREEQQAAADRSARQLLKAGEVEAAAEVIADARSAPLPIVATAPTSVPSTGTTNLRKNWKASIDDWPTLRADIGAGKYPEFDAVLQEVILARLQAQATSLNVGMAKRYPGTSCAQKAGLAGR